MSGHWLALYTFAQFKTRADEPVNDPFFSSEPGIWAAMERSDGFIARAGYEDEAGTELWGDQVFPKYWSDTGDGWAPSTISLWQDLESALAAVYRGAHGKILRLGPLFHDAIDYPPYVLWWVPVGHKPDWAEAVEHLERLGDDGPTAAAFTFKTAFDPAGRPLAVDSEKTRRIAGHNQQRADLPKAIQ